MYGNMVIVGPMRNNGCEFYVLMNNSLSNGVILHGSTLNLDIIYSI